MSATKQLHFYTQLGEKLKFIRVSKGVSLQDIGNVLEVSYQQYQKYEKGITRIPIDRFITLARYYNVSYSFFIDDIKM